jgi:NAD+ kinase
MKVYIFTKEQDSVYAAVCNELSALSFEQVGSIRECDVVITIGGDGTILKAGVKAASENKPLLGINTGRLGFMATLEKNELSRLSKLKEGDYSVSRRMLLEVQVAGAGEKVEIFHALNDVVLNRTSMNVLPEFVVKRSLAEVLRVRADGIIIATPTGATAYSLSAGGPIIEPELECFLLTALSPHTLFNRAMIFSPESTLSVAAKHVAVSVDGQEKFGGEVTVKKSDYHLALIDIDGNNFYDSVHNKLMKPLK